MPIPRAWTFQRDVIRQVYNREIYNWFKDIDPSKIPLPDNPTGRISAMSACLIGANDSIQAVLLKIMFFERIKQSINLLPKVTGVTYPDVDDAYEHRPLVTLYFLQDLAAVPDGFRAIPGRISFRLVNETSDTITEEKLKTLATRIKNNFALDGGYIWRKGKNKFTYRDKEGGMLLHLLCLTKEDGEELAGKVCDCLDRDYSEQKAQYIVPDRGSITTPSGTDEILGKEVKNRQWRPTVNVRFLYATCKISGLENAVALVDRSRQYFQAYEYL